MYGSSDGVVGSRPDVVASGRKYGLLRRPLGAPELTGRPGVGMDGRTVPVVVEASMMVLARLPWVRRGVGVA